MLRTQCNLTFSGFIQVTNIDLQENKYVRWLKLHWVHNIVDLFQFCTGHEHWLHGWKSGCVWVIQTPLLFHMQSLSTFILHHLTSSFAPVIITTANRGRHLIISEIWLVMDCLRLHNIYGHFSVEFYYLVRFNKISQLGIKYVCCIA